MQLTQENAAVGMIQVAQIQFLLHKQRKCCSKHTKGLWELQKINEIWDAVRIIDQFIVIELQSMTVDCNPGAD